MKSRVLLVLGAIAVLYAGGYILLSLNGAYVSSQTGNVKIAGGGPTIDDVKVWRPAGVRLWIFLNARGQIEREANFAGWLFYPLELLDRRYWHPSKHPFLDLLNGLSGGADH